jgi:hypothetical protein
MERLKTLFERSSDDIEDRASVEFISNGMLHWNAYSYYIDSWGSGNLSVEDTRLLYEVMKEYYENN